MLPIGQPLFHVWEGIQSESVMTTKGPHEQLTSLTTINIVARIRWLGGRPDLKLESHHEEPRATASQMPY